jgi:hypothetical protein
MSAPGANGRFAILGFPRSGTTLLSRLLDTMEMVSSPPETHLLSAAGRFLAEASDVEGPPIGVLAGLTFSGIAEEEVYAPLRTMVFAHHARIAGDKPVWVEKTATDIFYLDELEPLLAGHMRFICIVRNPLDVIASVQDLSAAMGAMLPELRPYAAAHGSPHIATAHAWAEATSRLLAFRDAHPADCYLLHYEDLVADTAPTLTALAAFMGIEPDIEAAIAAAFSATPRVGLGDFRIHELSAVEPARANSWRKRLPPATAARALPILAPAMEQLGYQLPRLPRPTGRDDSIRQFVFAKRLRAQARSRD